MVFAIAVFNVMHPGATIDGPGSEMPSLLSMFKSKVKGMMARRRGKVWSEGNEEQELTGGYQKISP
jgi:hypothetical protein